MRAKTLFLSIGVAALLTLTGCGGGESTEETKSKTILTADNYLNLAKYYYVQESRSRNAMKSRSMEHLKTSRNLDNQGTFYVKSNKKDGVVTSMIVKNSDALISIMIDNESKNVTVTLHGGNSDASETLSMAEFTSFDIDESVQTEGEAK